MADRELIRSAIVSAAKRKKHRHDVQNVLDNIEEHIDIIQRMITDESYIPSPYKTFEIVDGISGKRRIVSCPKFFPDQVMHWLSILASQDIFMRGMYEFVCGSVPGRGIHYGRKYIKGWIETDKKNTKYCAKLDISKFYPTIDHVALKSALRTKIKDAKLLWLFDAIIDSNGKGVPIGNYTSQWFANFILQKLDHMIKQELRIPHYMRYMDDMVLFSPNKKQLHAAVRRISADLKPLGMSIKRNWQVFRVDCVSKSGRYRGRDVDFMGFRFFRDKIIMRKRIALRARRLAAKISKISCVSHKHASAMLSYIGWFKHTDTYVFFNKYIGSKISISCLKGVIRSENGKRYPAA